MVNLSKGEFTSLETSHFKEIMSPTIPNITKVSQSFLIKDKGHHDDNTKV
jgi:hypothetical protein